MKRSAGSWLLALLALAVACGGVEEEPAEGEATEEASSQDRMAADDPDISPGGEATGLPEGWEVRLDRSDAPVADFRVTPEDGVTHVQTGPAGILYRPVDTVPEGDYTASASFTEYQVPPDHREAFGIVFGGSELQSENQSYAYFLVRADGSYLVKTRNGSETATVIDWTQSEAVNAQAEGEEGDLSNSLSVRVEGDAVHFIVNGTEVARRPASGLPTHGIVGLRVNHNLNVGVSGFAVES